jgi:hypothetical protein
VNFRRPGLLFIMHFFHEMHRNNTTVRDVFAHQNKKKNVVCILMKFHVGSKPKVVRQVLYCVRFQAFTAVTMKNVVFCDVMPCGSCKNRSFGGT